MNAIFRSIIGMSVATVAFILLFLSDPTGSRTPEAADDTADEYYYARDPTVSPNLFYKIIREGGSRGDELSAEVIIPDTVQSANKNDEPNFYGDLSKRKMAYIDKKLKQAFEISGIKEEVNNPDIEIGKIVERRKEMLKKKSGKGVQTRKTVKNKNESDVNRDLKDDTSESVRKERDLKTKDYMHDTSINGSSLNKRKNGTYLNASDTIRNNKNDHANARINDSKNYNNSRKNNNSSDNSTSNDNTNNNNIINSSNSNTQNHTLGGKKPSSNLIKDTIATPDLTSTEKPSKRMETDTSGRNHDAEGEKATTISQKAARTAGEGTTEDSLLPPTEDVSEVPTQVSPVPKGDGPLIYVITPTYKRPEQLAELTRLSQTLMHVRKIHWLVVEDAITPSAHVIAFLRECVVPHTYLLGLAVKKNKGASKARGVSNRNSALKWIKRKGIHSAVFYFADDDNTYDYRIFDEIRKTKQVSMFPVGLVTNFGVSSPIVRNGKITGFYDGWIAGRKFPVDMAGFAVNVKYYLKQGAPLMPYVVGYEEDGFLQNLHIQPSDIEPLADNCTKVMVWHTRTIKNALAQPMPKSDKVARTNLEKLKAHLLFQPSLKTQKHKGTHSNS